MRYPSRGECLAMLEEAGCPPNVIDHCMAVEALASKIGRLCGADPELIETGGLLHDIGRSRTHGVTHAAVGAEMARELELPEEIVLIIERHISAGLTREEARALGLPPRDYIPLTLEEKIICHADNLIAHDRKTSVAEAVEKLRRLGYSESADRVHALHEELSELCGTDLDLI